ncbi:hypothetical protein OFR22_04280 [Brachyspira hyodysenteriae]|uniref:Uncharacterized protein n=2 Tax=Brachyspira hyodysenteriae TaxID=159 RepID=A0A3B6VKU2_BRAHW|nr:hypothetical protein [Brachyspira hyodysenteriae]ACN84536.1 hypothetical protein BHWA1_02077 [Brachyspira hyodysenteriae WA1]ANN63387.1 hypothetical protein BHYOB78_05770 [Brachyspira hyodysenteriae ATCC 27164]AUJ50268.1 hypothetical protein BH718_01834 [Brachyspira hyodysenteriae]KLI13795.1 hypothetical protein SU45_11385 [Brachyspira hyodysenteriae]KLI14477.1 hypothetical protein SU44_10275 [Brachyspira hyodysenteriae]
MENIIDIINKAQLKTIDKDTFLSIASMCSFIPKSITENNTWKKLPLSAKEVYRTLVANYDYELGIAKTTHSQILNEAGIGGNATIVKSLDTLEEKGFITRVESKAKSHHYLMPYQEKFYATICNFEARDFSILYTVNKKIKKDTQIKQVTNKLFFKVCYNLSCLGIDEPQKLIDKYSSDGNQLRIILSMCNYVYIAKEKNLNKDINLNKYLIDSLKRGNITENIFDEKTMNTIKNILINRKQNITE